MTEIRISTLQDCVAEYLAEITASNPSTAGTRPMTAHEFYRQINAGRTASESPLESMFWHVLEKAKHACFVAIEPQKQVGRFRLDAFVQTHQCRHGIELDGKAFHDAKADRERDREILETGQVDDIIRIPFAAMNYFPGATFECLRSWDQSLATPRPWNVFDIAGAHRDADASTDGDGNQYTIEQWATEFEYCYEMAIYGGAFACKACSPLAWLKSWKVDPITRTVLRKGTPP